LGADFTYFSGTFRVSALDEAAFPWEKVTCGQQAARSPVSVDEVLPRILVMRHGVRSRG